MEHATRPEPDRAALAANLERLLREKRPAPLLPGSQLANYINEALGKSFREYFAPTEVPRLRTFVKRYVDPKLVQFTATKQGEDNMFSIPEQASTVEMAHQGSLWKTFVAVKPAGTLVYKPETASVSFLSLGLPVPEDCVAIEPVNLDEHREFMLAFCQQLEVQGHDATQLRSVASGQSDGLYQYWLAALRARKPWDRHWGEFRRDKVLELYERRLHAAGASADRAAQLRRELEDDHEVARAPKVAAAATVAANLASGAPAGGSREQREKRAREMLRHAADRLSYEQLLAIQLPLGVLLDLTGHPSD